MINFVYIIFILLIYGDYCFIEADAQSCNRKFVSVVDGGSTGTRLEIFEFLVDNLKELKKGYRIKSKIPLSKFSDVRANWSLMRTMLNNLTEKAKAIVPSECVAETAIYVQVTAGIRQLEESVSIRILNEVRAVLFKSTFKFLCEYVSILDIKKEGRFAWITVNYLFKRFDEDKSTYGMLDLGGGSTQIAFATTNDSLLNQTVNMSLFGKQYNIYVAGYNDLGINEIRAKYFNVSHCIDSCCKNQTLNSRCVKPNIETQFKFRNCIINIAGNTMYTNKYSYAHCFVEGVYFHRDVQPIRMYLKNMDFVAISAFYYIINSAANHTDLEMHEYRLFEVYLLTVSFCSNPPPVSSANPFQHYLCIDLVYILTLFSQAYQLKSYERIITAKSVNGTYLSWALGFAISTFSNA